MNVLKIVLFFLWPVFAFSEGNLSGIVIDDLTGLPIVGATVDVYKRQNFIASRTTGAGGVYTFSSLERGRYRVQASASSYQTATIGARVRNNQTTIVNFSLRSNAGSIAGVITEADTGNPISGVSIRVIKNNIIIAAGVSDGLGNYSITGISPGFYIVKAVVDSHEDKIVGARVIANTETEVNFSLEVSPGSIAGKVIDKGTGIGIQSATIEVILKNIVIFSVLSDENGEYSIEGIAPGFYVVEATADSYEDRVVGAKVVANTETGVDFSLEASPGSIAGVVIDEGTGALIPSATVEVILKNIVIFTALTDINGEYSIEGIAPGVYIVEAVADAYENKMIEAQVVANTETEVNFSLDSSPGSMAGVVTDADTSAPIPSTTIEVILKNVSILNNFVIYTALTDENGDYTITGIAPGSYVVVAVIDSHSDDVAAAQIVAETETEVDFALESNLGSIEGRVVDAYTSVPIPSTTIEVILKSVGIIDNTAIFRVLTDANGDYTITGIASGSYTVEASITDYQSESVAIDVIANVLAATIDFSLNLIDLPPVNLSGKVLVNRFLLQQDRIHQLSWLPSVGLSIIEYRVYRNGVVIANVDASKRPLTYQDHNRDQNITDVYTVTSINSDGDESSGETISLR